MSVNDLIEEEQLPAWMKQARRGVDWGALLIIGFCLIAAWSFIANPDLPATNQTEAYVYRSADYASAFEQGIVYTRWSPHSLQGYGAPIPYYYPSGAAYAGGLLSYLFTSNPITAVRILYILSLILAGSMMYTFIAQRTSALAGMMSALLYVFSPYVMVTVSHIEGDLPLAIGTALLPSLLWAVNRLLKRYQAIDFMLIAIIVAITIFTVPIILLQGTIATIVLFIVEFRNEPNWEKLNAVIGAFLVGILLSAFYWLPAVTQYDSVTWYPAVVNSPDNQVRFSDLFVLSFPIDVGLTIHRPVYNLGWGILFALFINLPIIVAGRSDRWLSTGFFILGIILITLILIFEPEQSSWFVLILFCFSITGSYIAQGSSRQGESTSTLTWVVIIFAFFASVPLWIVPAPHIPIEDVTSDAQIDYERSGYGYVGLPYGLPLPSRLSPSELAELAEIEPNGENFTRIRNSRVSAPLINETAYIGRYTLVTSDDISLIYNRAYFDGWRAITNTGNLELSESAEHLIRIDVPANTDTTVTFHFGFTNPTIIAWFVTAIAIGMCIVFWWYRWQRAGIDYDESILLNGRTSTVFLILLVTLVTIRGATTTSLFRDIFAQQPQYSRGTVLFVRTNYDNFFQLLAYDLSQETYSRGDAVNLVTYWTVNRIVENHYLIRLRVADARSRFTIYESRYSHPGYYPTNRWQTSSVIPQLYQFRLPDDVETGDYLMFFDVYVCDEPCSQEIMGLEQPMGEISIIRPLRVE